MTPWVRLSNHTITIAHVWRTVVPSWITGVWGTTHQHTPIKQLGLRLEYNQVSFWEGAAKSPILILFRQNWQILNKSCIDGWCSRRLPLGCSITTHIPLANARKQSNAQRAAMQFPSATHLTEVSPRTLQADRFVVPRDLRPESWGRAVFDFLTPKTTLPN